MSELQRREFLVAGGACLAAPLLVSLNAQGGLTETIESLARGGLTKRASASIGYWRASETLPDLSEVALPYDLATFSEASTTADGGIVSARRIASSGIGSEAQIRVVGCAMPQLSGHEKRAISLDVLFDTAHGRLPVHVLHTDCSGCSGGAMVLPVKGGRLAVSASTSEENPSVLEIPARRGVYVVGWRNPQTGSMPRWHHVRIASNGNELGLVTALGHQPAFPYAILTLDRLTA